MYLIGGQRERLAGLDVARWGIGWSVGHNLWFIRGDRQQMLGVLSLYRWTGIVMHAEGSCFGLDSIAACVKVAFFTVVLSLAGADVLSGSAYPFGSGGIVWVLTTAPPHQYILQILLADHFQIESRSVVL